ncbi:MAG: HAMP domain-containing protein, partial [Negativicutes bacterium]|nr:HAMP domain-containing protein [Negativicutes bacterium]
MIERLLAKIAAAFSHNRDRLRDKLYGHYMASALLPILFIEVTLLIVYFAMASIVTGEQIKTLRADAAMSLEQISTRTAETIDRELLDIQGDLEIVAAVYRDIFSNPQRYSVDPQSADFGITDKGTYIKTRDNGGSALFYSTAAPGYDRHKALITEAADPVMKQCKQGNPLIAAVYLNTWDSMNRYYPFMDVSIYDPHLEIPTFNFYYEADAAHNPERKPVWLSTYLDPAGQGWMISVITPIYRQDFLEGVLGIDITIDTIVSRVEQTDVPWGGYAMLVTGSGDVLALAGRGQEQLGMKLQAKHSYDAAVQQDTTINPENNLRKSSSRELNKLGDLVLGGDSSGRGEMIINGHNLLLSYKKISVSDIYLVVFVPTAEVFASSLRIERIARYVGYAAIAMMLLFYWLFFIMLKKRAAHMAEDVARPVAALESVAQQVGTGRLDIELPAAENRDEIGVLTEEFGRMVHNLRAAAAREEKYRKDLEMLAERLKAQNEELQVAYRAKDDLLNNMTHELVTPLNHINGYISMVLELSLIHI